MNLSKFFKELKRRNVIRETIAYALVAWIILQVAALTLPILNAPAWILKTLTLVLIAGIPVVVILSWIYEFTNKGLKRTTVLDDKEVVKKRFKRLNQLIVVGIVIGLTLLVVIGSKVKSMEEYNQYSIAILPFKDLSAQQDISWFVEGIREDIWQRLVRIDGMDPRSNRSTDAFKDSEKTNSGIAEELQARHILEGSVRQLDGRAVINVKLWDNNEKLIFSKEYNEDFKDLFKLQKSVSRSVVEAMDFKIGSQVDRVLESSETENLDAYLLVKKGEKTILDNFPARAINYFKDALQLDSTYANAYANLSYAYTNLAWRYRQEHVDDVAKLKFYAEKAFEYNPNSSRAFLALALYYDTIVKNEKLAREYYEKALNIRPNDPVIHYEFGWGLFLFKEREIQNSIYHLKRAMEIEPLEWKYGRELMLVYAYAGRQNDAIKVLNKAAPLFPEWRYQKPVEYWKAELAKFENGHRNVKLDFLLNQIKMDSLNPHWFTELAIHYDEYLNNDSLFLTYAEAAYRLDKKRIIHYMNALLDNYRFNEVQSLFDSQDFKGLKEDEKNNVFWRYFSYSNNYEALKSLIDTTSLARDSLNYIKYKIEAGLIDNLKTIGFKDYNSFNVRELAIIYAQLEQRDSMYYYLYSPRIEPYLYPSIDVFQSVNGNHVFDKYRKEPEYKAFQKRNYLE